MSRNLERKIGDLEEKAFQDLEEETFKIYERYGRDARLMAERITPYERSRIDKYIEYRWPEVVSRFMDDLEIFGPTLYKAIFEFFIYPKILEVKKEDENEFLVLGIDHAYIQLGYPEYWEAFMGELRQAPRYEDDPEAAINWRVPEELTATYKEIRAEVEEVKNRIRDEIRRGEEEDARLQAEEEALDE